MAHPGSTGSTGSTQSRGVALAAGGIGSTGDRLAAGASKERASTCFRCRWLCHVLAAILIGAVAAVLPVAPLARADTAGALGAPAAALNELEASLFDYVNAERAANGLAPVEFDPDLLPIARERAAEQIPLVGLSHYDAAGQLVFVTLLGAAGLEYRLAGENLARLGGDPRTAAARADWALMNSPTHRANILEPSFNRLAIGEATDGAGHIIFAQIFRAL